MTFCNCGAAKVTVLQYLKLWHHVDKWLFVRLVLREDSDWIFPLFSKQFHGVSRDADVFPGVRLYTGRWYVMDYAYKRSWTIRRCYFCLLRSALVTFATSQEAWCTFTNAVGSTLLRALTWKWWRGMREAVLTDVEGLVAYSETMCMGGYIAFSERFSTRI